ncbi:TetR/AcrR family transcriptional regulator [Solihabitans fulvus]|uniref:TetR/AcrR family transcriptional regulator n=1 Tax=Solihabitans fulvus TaxID=1892852 RepID=A0A5B2XHR6_9PSEU|nr:TetR family transcriptional regulator [Solihabitans fulvus]KAA2262953.1 TetR/AcrR family transcriptional regulator [Solihabitans fulvus]
MGHITPFSERARASLREELLDAAAELLAAHGFHGLRMGEVAAAAGVSRQTVYNEFGNKESLVQAITLQRTAEFLDGVELRLGAAADPLQGMRAATLFTLEHAAEDRLINSVLTGTDAEDLLPFLTTRGQPVLLSAAQVLSHHLREHCAELPEEQVELLAEASVRLALSHLLMPTGTREEAADAVVAVISAALRGQQPPDTPAKEQS